MAFWPPWRNHRMEGTNQKSPCLAQLDSVLKTCFAEMKCFKSIYKDLRPHLRCAIELLINKILSSLKIYLNPIPFNTWEAISKVEWEVQAYIKAAYKTEWTFNSCKPLLLTRRQTWMRIRLTQLIKYLIISLLTALTSGHSRSIKWILTKTSILAA